MGLKGEGGESRGEEEGRKVMELRTNESKIAVS